MSAHFEPDDINLKGLENLTKALKMKNPPVIQVGVIGGKARKKPEGKTSPKTVPTNAEIGAVHEYGSPAKNIPARSWLRMPLKVKLQGQLEKDGLFDEKALNEVIRTGSIVPWLEKVKVAALATIKEGFASGGWGKWPSWKKGYTNQTGLKLVDTRQLRDSVDARIVGK